MQHFRSDDLVVVNIFKCDKIQIISVTSDTVKNLVKNIENAFICHHMQELQICSKMVWFSVHPKYLKMFFSAKPNSS